MRKRVPFLKIEIYGKEGCPLLSEETHVWVQGQKLETSLNFIKLRVRVGEITKWSIGWTGNYFGWNNIKREGYLIWCRMKLKLKKWRKRHD